MLYVSDLDKCAQVTMTRDLGLMPIRYSYDDSQEEGATLYHPIKGIVTKDSDWGNTR